MRILTTGSDRESACSISSDFLIVLFCELVKPSIVAAAIFACMPSTPPDSIKKLMRKGILLSNKRLSSMGKGDGSMGASVKSHPPQ